MTWIDRINKSIRNKRIDEEVIVSLLASGNGTAYYLSNVTGRDRSEVSRSLQRLKRKGACDNKGSMWRAPK